MKIKLGEKEVDLKAALPITLGDVRRLKKDFGVKLADLSNMDADIIAKIVLMLSQKVNVTITEAEVDTIPLVQLGDIAIFLQTDAVEADRPTSGSSTS